MTSKNRAFIFTLLTAEALAGVAGADDAAGVAQTKQRWRVGIEISLDIGAAQGLVGTAPVPVDWPEQQVTIVDQEKSINVKRIGFRTLRDGVKQMVVDVPRLTAGETATAYVIFDVAKSDIAAPEDIGQFELPARPPAEVRPYLLPSPLIESQHPKIRALAAEIGGGEEPAWEQAAAIFAWVRANVEYQESGSLKGALAALQDGTGDCEELTSLFIALCRARKIPARMVWVPGHCYPEFYLQDKQGGGQWFPCQAAGAGGEFGHMAEPRVILQKGDNFKVPEQSERLHYAGTLKAANVVGGPPAIKFVAELLQ